MLMQKMNSQKTAMISTDAEQYFIKSEIETC